MPTQTSQTPIYLDYNATTPGDESVIAKLPTWIDSFGNPSSIHWAGQGIKAALREAKEVIAQSLGIQNHLELVFTSGASESNNLVLRSFFEHCLYQLETKPHFISSSVEHPSVLRTLEHLHTLGATYDLVSVNREGIIDLEQYQSLLAKASGRPTLVSLQMANNETGTLFPVAKMAKMAKKLGFLFHSDCVQYYGKGKMDLTHIDYASFSGHKFYALKGTGFLYVRRGSPLISQLTGGAQERGRRGGTENTLGILALGEMAKQYHRVLEKAAELSLMRNSLEERVLSHISQASLTGAQGFGRLPNTSSFVIPEVSGETLLISLDVKGYAVSTGAACASGNPEPSSVLLNMGLSREEASSSLRVSLGWQTTNRELESFTKTLIQVVEYLRSLNSKRNALVNKMAMTSENK